MSSNNSSSHGQSQAGTRPHGTTDSRSSTFPQGQPGYTLSRSHFWHSVVYSCCRLRISTEDESPREFKQGVLDEKIESKSLFSFSNVHGLTSFKDKDVENSTILAQGQRAVFIDQNGKGTRQCEYIHF
jgi:hypothetical protein